MSEYQDQTKAIGKDYTLIKLIGFVSAPIFTQFALSVLSTIDDGLFISRYIGMDALAAFSLCTPIFFLREAVGSLLGGAEPHCSMKLGEKDNEGANSDFTTTAILCLVLGSVFAVVLNLILKPLLYLLGASDNLLQYALPLMRMISFIYPIALLNSHFSRFYVVAGKPSYSMVTTLMSAFCNIFFDYIFIVRLKTGILGTCYANYISFAATVTFGLVFYSGKKCEIGFTKKLSSDVIKMIKNEFRLGMPMTITNIALAINASVCTRVVLSVAGEKFLAAYTIVNNIQFAFMSCFFGYNSAICPMASYAYGQKNAQRLKKIISQAITIVIMLSLLIIVNYYIFYKPLTLIYMTNETVNDSVRETVYLGLRLAPLAFIFFGFNVLIQDGFNAINNSKASTTISIFENVIFSNLSIIIMASLFGMLGVWLSFALQEALTFVVALYIIYKNRDNYGYGKSGKAKLINF